MLNNDTSPKAILIRIEPWIERKGTDGLAEYRKINNLASIDGLAGLDSRKIL